jgi:predicted transcriptional regulator
MRKVLGLRQVEISQRAGIERTRLSKWESGTLELTEEELQALRDLIVEATWERSEMGMMPLSWATEIGATSKERGRAFREHRLRWRISQTAVAEVADYPQDLISLWETGYGECRPEEIERLGKALASLIDKQHSTLQWWANPAELEKRRTSLGVSRKQLAKHAGKTEKWLIDLEGGHTPITPEVAEPLWEYLASREAERGLGQVARITSVLGAPVIPSRPVMTLAKQVKLKRLMQQNQDHEAVIGQLKKQLRVSQELCATQEKLAGIYLGRANALEEKLDEKVEELEQLSRRMGPSAEQEEIVRIAAALKAVLVEE